MIILMSIMTLNLNFWTHNYLFLCKRYIWLINCLFQMFNNFLFSSVKKLFPNAIFYWSYYYFSISWILVIHVNCQCLWLTIRMYVKVITVAINYPADQRMKNKLHLVSLSNCVVRIYIIVYIFTLQVQVSFTVTFKHCFNCSCHILTVLFDFVK